MALFQVVEGRPIKWIGQAIEGIKYPRNIEVLWTETALAAVGLHKLVEADPIPADMSSSGTDTLVVEGKATLVHRLTKIVITRQAVKDEAAQRILEIAPEWKQRNMNAQATVLLQSRVLNGSWTEAEQAQSDTLNAVWAAVVAIRTASDKLEVMMPIPLDYANDKYWT